MIDRAMALDFITNHQGQSIEVVAQDFLEWFYALQSPKSRQLVTDCKIPNPILVMAPIQASDHSKLYLWKGGTPAASIAFLFNNTVLWDFVSLMESISDFEIKTSPYLSSLHRLRVWKARMVSKDHYDQFYDYQMGPEGDKRRDLILKPFVNIMGTKPDILGKDALAPNQVDAINRESLLLRALCDTCEWPLYHCSCAQTKVAVQKVTTDLVEAPKLYTSVKPVFRWVRDNCYICAENKEVKRMDGGSMVCA